MLLCFHKLLSGALFVAQYFNWAEVEEDEDEMEFSTSGQQAPTIHRSEQVDMPTNFDTLERKHCHNTSIGPMMIAADSVVSDVSQQLLAIVPRLRCVYPESQPGI